MDQTYSLFTRTFQFCGEVRHAHRHSQYRVVCGTLEAGQGIWRCKEATWLPRGSQKASRRRWHRVNQQQRKGQSESKEVSACVEAWNPSSETYSENKESLPQWLGHRARIHYTLEWGGWTVINVHIMRAIGSHRRLLSKRGQGQMGVRMNPLEPMWRTGLGQDQGGVCMAAPRGWRNHELEESIGMENGSFQVQGSEH